MQVLAGQEYVRTTSWVCESCHATIREKNYTDWAAALEHMTHCEGAGFVMKMSWYGT